MIRLIVNCNCSGCAPLFLFILDVAPAKHAVREKSFIMRHQGRFPPRAHSFTCAAPGGQADMLRRMKSLFWRVENHKQVRNRMLEAKKGSGGRQPLQASLPGRVKQAPGDCRARSPPRSSR